MHLPFFWTGTYYRYMLKTIIIIAVLIIIALVVFVSVRTPESMDTPSSIDTEAISSAVQNGEAILLDVRTDQELETDGYAAGSTHFDVARLEAGELPDIAHDLVVYTYCAAGGRAERAKTILEEAGFTNVTNIGGLSDWEAAGGEVVR